MRSLPLQVAHFTVFKYNDLNTRTGGTESMNWAAIDELAAKLMINRKAHRERERGFVYYHGKRVGNSAMELRRLLFPDHPELDDALRLAGMFHDVGKGLSPHGRYGSVIFTEALHDIVDDKDLIAFCSDMILHHGDRQTDPSPFNISTQLLQDADMLDHSGSYGVWMCAQFYSVFDGCMTDGVKFNAETSEKYYADNVDLLNFDLSKSIFRDKIDAENAFFARAAYEAEGLFPGISNIQ